MTSGKKTLFVNGEEAKNHLIACGQEQDSDIDVIESAFAFALLSNPQCDIERYRDRIALMANDLQHTYDDLSAQSNTDDVFIQAKALKSLLADKHGFTGDSQHYDHFDNMNLCHVMDRQKGLPITLCILAIGLCRHQGWQAEGINFPGHFIMRLEKEGDRVMIDPFQNCEILEAKDLRLILKRVMGEYAELSTHYYEACSNREMLLRLQNNLKYRLIDNESYQAALDIVEKMAWIAPHDYRLNLDKAVLFARLEQPKAAIDNLSTYINQVQDPYDRAEAERFLIQLQSQLN